MEQCQPGNIDRFELGRDQAIEWLGTLAAYNRPPWRYLGRVMFSGESMSSSCALLR